MNKINSVKEILNSSGSLEEKFRVKTDILGWDYTDVLYSFLGVYTIGLNAFYKQDFECKGLIIRPKIRENNRQQAYNYKFILKHSNNDELNNLVEMKNFISVYQTIGNIIPIWPGGNVHRGQNQCYDIPDIYFNKATIKKYSETFFNTSVKDNNFLGGIMNGEYSEKRIEDFLLFDKFEYIKFLKHITNIINKRNKDIEEYLKK